MRVIYPRQENSAGILTMHQRLEDFVTAPRRYAFVDSLRGLAFLAVFAFHASQRIAALPALLSDILGRGFAGVQLFFVVSAFTLCVSMAGRAREPASIRAYFIRRVFRIAPMFWFAIGLYLAADGFGPHWGVPDGLDGRHVALAVLLLHGADPHALNGVVPGGWSVAVEMQFYLILPLLFRWTNTLRRAFLLWAATIGFSAAALPALEVLLAPFYPAAQRDLVHQFAFYSLPVQLPVFCCGLILYRMLGPDRARLARVERFLPGKPSGRAAVINLIVLAIALPVLWTSVPITLLPGFPGSLGYGVIFALFAYGLAIFPLYVFDNPLTRFFGRISYSGYLLHFAVLELIARMVPPAVAAMPLPYLLVLGAGALTLTSVLAAMTHEWIERPGIALGQRLIEKLDVVAFS